MVMKENTPTSKLVKPPKTWRVCSLFLVLSSTAEPNETLDTLVIADNLGEILCP